MAASTPAIGEATAAELTASDHTPERSVGADCYLRMGFTSIERHSCGFHLHCLACSWSEEAWWASPQSPGASGIGGPWTS